MAEARRRRAQPVGILSKELPEGDSWITHHKNLGITQ